MPTPDLLIDDSPHHRDGAAKFGRADHYVVVPAYGSPEDSADPLAWVRRFDAALLSPRAVALL